MQQALLTFLLKCLGRIIVLCARKDVWESPHYKHDRISIFHDFNSDPTTVTSGPLTYLSTDRLGTNINAIIWARSVPSVFVRLGYTLCNIQVSSTTIIILQTGQ
ncbi:hypothetical protein B0H19DRAFT_1085196 [Mycena capillaripes]|nr:hypothetical protein B0H19DRAFT_1085196 [Mycena capillaripes]